MVVNDGRTGVVYRRGAWAMESQYQKVENGRKRLQKTGLSGALVGEKQLQKAKKGEKRL